MDRRDFLKRAGVLTIAFVGGRVLYSFGEDVPEVGDGPQFEPWKTWDQDSKKGPLSVVRAAIISSNAYNSQPWLFKIDASKIALYADLKRNLGAFDPYLRELHFSLGCALENLILASAANGYKSSITYLQGQLGTVPADPKPELVAQVDLSAGAPTVNELYQAIQHRHTNRNPFDSTKPVPQDFREALWASVNEEKVKLFLFSEEADRKKIADLIAVASGKFMSDPDVSNSTRAWFRTTPEEMQKKRDGVLIVAPPPATQSPPRTAPQTAPKSGPLETYTNLMLTGRLFGLIAVRDRYDREQTIRAGRVWQRAHLLATARDLAARPANGAVEIIDHEKRLNQQSETASHLAEITGDATWQPTFMFYMGYPTIPGVASPRRDVQDVLIS